MYHHTNWSGSIFFRHLNGTRIKNLETIWHLISWEFCYCMWIVLDIGRRCRCRCRRHCRNQHQTIIPTHISQVIKFSIQLWVSGVFIFHHYQSMKFDMFIYFDFQVTCMKFLICNSIGTVDFIESPSPKFFILTMQ